MSAPETLLNVPASGPQVESIYKRIIPLSHDGEVHHPLGAGSYLFKDRNAYLQSILRATNTHPDSPSLTKKTTASFIPQQTTPPMSDSEDVDDEGLAPRSRPGRTQTLIIHIGAQPNNSPHAGTITVFTTAFVLARDLQQAHKELVMKRGEGAELGVCVQLDIVDTAPAISMQVSGISYQISQRASQHMEEFMPDYDTLSKALHDFVAGAVDFRMEKQETLMCMPDVPVMLRRIIEDRANIGPELSPETGCLAIRSACPFTDASGICGRADKHGIKNEYHIDKHHASITFYCSNPAHPPYTRVLEDPQDVVTLELNTPLRNLLRSLVYAADTTRSLAVASLTDKPERYHMRVTGSDYAGKYQEQMLRVWHRLARMDPRLAPHFEYSPLIEDWSGSKVSKSLYVKRGAYQYLRDADMAWLLSFKEMREAGMDPAVLFKEVEGWIHEPRKMFRAYSLEYLRMQLLSA